ncbi:MAG: dipeptidyl peptidase 3, partial [Muribaculaceae bacterium]|nr:dipeptidyl peptidase 3 [Muribaculaceae bacterium]
MKYRLSTIILAAMLTHQANAVVDKNFDYHVDRFADIEVLRYEVPEFDRLSLNQKLMIYYLGEAAQAGRDILWDQNGRYNLQIRKLFENIYKNYKGDKNSADYKAFETYLKQIWFGNGIYHHYSTDKFTPLFSENFFIEQVNALPQSMLPLANGQTKEEMLAILTPVIFDPTVMPKRVSQDGSGDVVAASASNLYGDGVTQAEVEAYYADLKDPNDPTPISYGLNAKVVKENGKIKEEHYHLNGLYGPAIAKIIYWLDMAKSVAENDAQKAYITKLIDYYITGDLRLFDEYSILWAEDTKSDVDFVNGFIES